MKRGFTLIELLVVVGIIAILALIAVPNFLEAQIRAKVAAVKNDERIIAIALESYSVDSNHYPPGSGVGWYYDTPFAHPVSRRLYTVTTPLAYLTNVPQDRFVPRDSFFSADPGAYDTYDYVTANDQPALGSGISSGAIWRVLSAGPDLFQAYGGRLVVDTGCNEMGVDYDPTNGTVSVGDIVRVGARDTTHGDPLDPSNPNRPGIVRAPRYIEQWN